MTSVELICITIYAKQDVVRFFHCLKITNAFQNGDIIRVTLNNKNNAI